MGFCMTKTFIAEKVGHFNTVLRASLLSLLPFCSFVALSDGYCVLRQDSVSGSYEIVCTGDGLVVNYVDRTNEVYVIENCEELKLQLLSAVDSVTLEVSQCIPYSDYIARQCEGIDRMISSSSWGGSQASANNIRAQVAYISRTNELLRAGLDSSVASLGSLRSTIEGIQCGSCSEGDGGGSCCDVDLTPILNILNEAQELRQSIYDVLDGSQSVVAGSSYFRQGISRSGFYTPNYTYLNRPSSSADNIHNILSVFQSNLADTQTSINNYLYKITLQLYSLTNDVHDLTFATTNFFSFFRDEVSVRPALEDWTPDEGDYHDFLTNYYLRVVNNDDSLSSNSKTNWFARIETLLASLVFLDSSGTNTVDVSAAEDESQTVLGQTLDTVDSFRNSSEGQLDSFRNTSQSLVSSLRSISASFSRVADPGTVQLVNLSSSSGNRNSVDSISFETSDIRNLVEACHCVTTLCWCFSGLLLLYYFLHWTVRTSYGLLMFAWGVFSSIFKH